MAFSCGYGGIAVLPEDCGAIRIKWLLPNNILNWNTKEMLLQKSQSTVSLPGHYFIVTTILNRNSPVTLLMC